MQNVLAVILGGGAGSRLYPLTRERAKPAVPLGGKYRLVDIPISNCLNSGIDRNVQRRCSLFAFSLYTISVFFTGDKVNPFFLSVSFKSPVFK